MMILCGCLLTTAFAVEPADLRRNPFVSPLEQDANSSSGRDSNSASNEKLELKGIIVSGRESLVNFGGHMMVPGDEVAGYLLVSVAEGEAIFNRNGEVIRMSLYAEPEE
jgi:hypothetical protein